MSKVKLDFESDVWPLVYANKTVGFIQNWDFRHFKSSTLKNQVKQYFWDGYYQEFIKQDSLYRYCYGLKHFTSFLEEYGLKLNYFDELTYQNVMQFVWYLNQNVKSARSRIGLFFSLKAVVTYGQIIGLKRFPKADIFPNDPSRLLHMEDELKSKEIPLEVMAQVVEALKTEPNIVLKTMIIVAKETGIRLSELLSLKVDSPLEDFMGGPMLFVYSIKVDQERVIPIQKKLIEAIRECVEFTSNFRGDSDLLFLTEEGEVTPQWLARYLLSDFIDRNNIKLDPDNDEELYHFTWHSFRHSFGTELINSGLAPANVRELLGQNSYHSTSLYAKIRAITLNQEYKKVGFVGIVTKDLSSLGKPVTDEELKSGSLPDGICRNALNGNNSCKNFNKCLLCPKFITTPDYLEIHKAQLDRIRKDRTKYMDDMYICNFEKVERIEIALEAIIEQLEALL